MKKIIVLLFMATLSSCVTLFAPKKQNFKILNPNQNSVIYETDTLGDGLIIKTKDYKDFNAKQLIILKDGYKKSYQVISDTKKSFFRYLNYPFFITGFGMFASVLDITKPKTRRYKNYTVKEPKIKIPIREKSDKFVFIKTSSFDVDKKNFNLYEIKHKNYLKGKKKLRNKISLKKDYKLDNTIFTSTINNELEKNGLTDTSENLFKDNTNSTYLKITINSIDIHRIKYEKGLGSILMDFYETELEVNLELYDLYNNLIHNETLTEDSGQFSIDSLSNSKKTQEAVTEMINDAILTSVFKFLDSSKKKGYLTRSEQKITIDKKTIITNNSINNNVSEALSSTITVLRPDGGHGSGCLISQNGYIVTNYHVISGLKDEDELKIIDSQSKEYTAKVIQINSEYDLALIKVNGDFKQYYKLPTNKNYSIGNEVFVLGTPKSVELGQSISKGIVSGIRKTGHANYIQTDASINGGNSGGALISTKTYELIGIVNAKLFGVGVEGIGFAIPAYEAIKALGIEIKE